jgi:hypothetical protein
MSTTLPTTHTEASALYKEAGKVLSKPKKVDPNPNHVKVAEPSLSSREVKKGRRLGVMSITKAENAQLGLILRYLSYQKRYLKLPEDVLLYPDAFEKLCGRYST